MEGKLYQISEIMEPGYRIHKVDYTTTVRHLHEDNRCTVLGVQPEYYRIEYDQF